MKRTAEEIIQELQDQLIILSKKVKQAEQKHFSNVMSCGHGQYPKHLEIKTTAGIYSDLIASYSAHKKLLNLLFKHREAGGNQIIFKNLFDEMDEIIEDTVLSQKPFVISMFKEWRLKLLSLEIH